MRTSAHLFLAAALLVLAQDALGQRGPAAEDYDYASTDNPSTGPSTLAFVSSSTSPTVGDVTGGTASAEASATEKPTSDGQGPGSPPKGAVIGGPGGEFAERPINGGPGDSCEQGDQLTETAKRLVKERLPSKVFLTRSSRGSSIKLTLDEGFLAMPSKELISEPTCFEEGDSKVYNFLVKFEKPAGAYSWKIENLFGRTFSESALIMLDIVLAEFSVSQKKISGDLKLDKVVVGQMKNLDVKVNIPEKVLGVNMGNRALAFVVSRVTTFVVNRSKAAIADDIGRAFVDATKESMKHVPTIIERP